MNLETKIFTPVGRLDASTVAKFRQEVESLLGSQTALLLIDLKEVPFVDSSGLGALVSVSKMMRSRNGDVALCSLSDGVRLLFKLTRMEKVFEIYPDQAAFTAHHSQP